MTTAAAILARLDAIEQQNQRVLALLAKMVDGEAPAQPDEDGMTASRRLEIIQMGHEAARLLGKKQQNREVRV